MLSVCMATYNGEKYIREQVASILPQLGKEDELIVSDDGSQDHTLSIIQSFSDPRIIVLHNQGIHGYVGNFENVLKHAKGDFIFLSDQDDKWMPNKVRRIMEELSNADLVVHDAELIDGEGRSLGTTYYSQMHDKTDFWSNLLIPRYLGCCMAFNKKVLNYTCPFPTYRRGHDYWIGCAAAMRYKVVFIPDVLIKYRRHGENASPSTERSPNSVYKKVFKRSDMIFELVKRKLRF